MTPKLSMIEAMRFWVRFIDDCLGVWRGTKRSFYNFVNMLNIETMKYGIKFPVNEVQFGKSVHFLEICAYLDNNNVIHYKGYTKPTDAKRYLNPNSFQPQSVFNSIPFSQLLRTLRNNSKTEERDEELKQCITHFEASGYTTTKLNVLKGKAIDKFASTTTETDEGDTLVFPVHFFEGVSNFKALVHSLKTEFQELIGDTRIIFALKKNSSIGNRVVQNKKLSFPNNPSDDQRCNGRGCRQCPQVSTQSKVVINDVPLRIPRHLNCKSKNVIYLWTCKLCGLKEAYFGRTIQKCHLRTNGHRGCFDEERWEKSALSMHAREVHQTQFSLDIFEIAVVDKVSPQQLRRTEFKYIDKYRTLSFGLNRYQV